MDHNNDEDLFFPTEVEIGMPQIQSPETAQTMEIE